jgi:hypothetical protein
MARAIITTAVLVLAWMGGSAIAADYYVATNGSDTNSGSSWAEAFASIQKAIDTAYDGDGVYIKEGTYYESVSFKRKAITVGSTDPNDWDMVSRTIIDANGAENAVSFRSSNNSDAVLTGVTITGGRTGIYCDRTSPLISNCIVTGNGTSSRGGGMLSFGACSPRVTKCVFSENVARYGGGMYNDECSAIVTDCVFYANTAVICGGGLFNKRRSYVTVINCVFYDNRADEGDGGGIFNEESLPNIINCTFSENYADMDGGGIYNYESHATVINCIFWEDYAGEDTDEIYNNNPYPTFSHCCIQGGLNRWACGGDDSIDGGANIRTNPVFVDWTNPAGCDGKWGTHDDGLRLTCNPGVVDNACVDAADGDAARSTDICGLDRVDTPGVDNTGSGSCKYVDMGAYEAMLPAVEAAVDAGPLAVPDGGELKWIKVRLLLPEGFAAKDVDTGRDARLDPFCMDSDQLNVPTNARGSVEVEAYFDRTALCGRAPFVGTITVEAFFTSGQGFYGTQTIELAEGIFEGLSALASHWLEGGCSEPGWCEGTDVDQNSRVNLVDFALNDGCHIEITGD